MKSGTQPHALNLTEIITSYIARDFYLLEVDSRIPTMEEYVRTFSVSRGTVQNAIRNIVDRQGAALAGQGVAGAYLRKKNPEVLLSLAGWGHFIGASGIPQTQSLIALSSALYMAAKEEVTIAYVQGADRRLQGLLAGKLDFILSSKMAAIQLQKSHSDQLTLALELADQSYLTGYNVLTKKGTAKEDIHRVGYDPESPDHVLITRRFFPEDEYAMVHMHFSRLPTAIRNGSIDACVFNRDILESMKGQIDFSAWEIVSHDLLLEDKETKEGTRAVLLCAAKDYRTADFIRKIFDRQELENFRQAVLDESVLPIL